MRQDVRIFLVTLLVDLLGLGEDVLNVADHVERVLGERVVLAREDLSTRLHGVLERDETALDTSEDLGHSEGLGHETLHLTGALDSELVLLGQLIHTQNGNDILEGLVVLELSLIHI